MPSKRTIAPALAQPYPMPALTPADETGPTMTTVEIATRTGKAHHNVMRDVRRMEEALGGGRIKFDCTYRDDQGKEKPCYLLAKREILILTAGYSFQLRARIVDRLDELERAAKAGPAIPTTFADALRLAAEQADTLERQAALIEAQRPAVAVVQRITASSASITVTEAAKAMKVPPKHLFGILAEKGLIFRRGTKGRWQASQRALEQGILEHDAFPVATEAGPVEAYSVKVTPKGFARFAAMLAGVQLVLGIDDAEAASLSGEGVR